MGFLTNLYSQNKFDVTKTFNSLRDIRWRAEHILEKKNRTPEQFESAAKGIHDFIAEYKNEKLAEEIENYAQQIYERGGWQLDYLDGFDYDRQPSMSEIRDLLESWPRWAGNNPDIPTEENIYCLYALQDILSTGYLYDDIDGFPFATEAECYAVLALMKLDDAIGLLITPEKINDEKITIHSSIFFCRPENIIISGNIIVEAMEIVCYAERSLSNDELSKWRAELKEKMDAERVAEKAAQLDFSAIGKAGAIKRHAPMVALREWAVDLYRSGNWKSANEAAFTLKSQVVAHGRTIGANLTEQNAQKTIARWFSKSV